MPLGPVLPDYLSPPALLHCTSLATVQRTRESGSSLCPCPRFSADIRWHLQTPLLSSAQVRSSFASSPATHRTPPQCWSPAALVHPAHRPGPLSVAPGPNTSGSR